MQLSSTLVLTYILAIPFLFFKLWLKDITDWLRSNLQGPSDKGDVAYIAHEKGKVYYTIDNAIIILW